MISIFYDLETTDLERVGQILNFAFVVVDDEFNQLDVLTAKVKLSRLQLPRVGAILANRTNVLLHQQEATLSENAAIHQIEAFIEKWLKRADGSVAFVGFNSAAFDLHYLRTVYIRNGLNPYHKTLVSRDVLLVARYLMATNEVFRQRVFQYFGTNKINLRLESLSKMFSLLDGSQEHESLSDVLLTISLAKELHHEMGVDVRTFEPYQVKSLHASDRGSVHRLVEPLSSGFGGGKISREYTATLLDSNERYALWIDLEKYGLVRKGKKDLKECIKWRKFAEHIVICSPENVEAQYQACGVEAVEALRDINLNNYFTESNCDIEQFIYRISPFDISVLAKNLQNNDGNANRDILQLVRRYWLENWNGEESIEYWNALKRYAQYRYGGNLLLKNVNDPSRRNETRKSSLRHPTLAAMFQEIEKVLLSCSNADELLISALRSYYITSDIYRVSSFDLMSQDI